MTRTLSIGCGAYDRTWPLIAGLIRPEGFDFDWQVLPPEEVFLKGMLTGAFDICEMSTATYMVQRARGENLYTALPIFVSRKFRHSALYVRSDAGIERPEDLRGRRIGVPEWQITAIAWVRGILSDWHGVGVADAEWLIGGIDEPGRGEKIPVEPPAGVKARRLGAEETLWALVEAGELDAIIAPRAPLAFHEGDSRIRRLFSDVRAAETAYYKASGQFPIMHIIGLRNDHWATDPGVATRLFDAFEAGRRHALNELHQVAYDAPMLPWAGEELAYAEALMGRDYWTYGLDARNREGVEILCRYAHEQGLTDRQLAVEEVFPAS
ncbi:ABC transporter substrate-binding protein [Alkalilacustris brevis]|uniref:ABC transporter substrate-binding protein n=1 Tax=Alkalilacustris brevis TaxID=2026338 RepID=UPI000E0DDA83|nr:ABC transporter substrate-binding protein [Alkalilacustris brevis]